MYLNVIGCWAPYPKTGEACSGYLIQSENTNILLDCGHGVFSNLGNYIDFNLLDAVFISHFHPDHYVDLYALRHALRGSFMLNKRKRKLKVFMPEKPTREYEYFTSVPEFEVVKVKDNMSAEVEGVKLSFFGTHHSIPGLGIVIENKGKKIFYTGDTSLFPKLYENHGKIDLLVAECCLFRSENEYAQKMGHMTTEDVAILANKLKAEKLLATHFWPEYEVEKLAGEIKDIYKRELFMAKAGLRINV